MSKICANCSSINPEEALFCHDCGGSFSLANKNTSVILDNRYEIKKTIKSGAMGCLYKAWDTRLGTFAAIKKITITDPDGSDEYYTGRFKKEAAILSSLHHEGLPFVIDFFSDKDIETSKQAHYIIMTYIDGMDLEEIMEDRNEEPLTVEEATDIFMQILDILDYLHTQNPPVIYRDLKPSNVMMSNGRVFLVDFGIAKILNEGKKGTSIGTPGYAAPEQYNGYADERSDIFSLGVLMHYLLSGREPNGKTFTFERLRNIDNQIPDYLDEIIMKMVNLFSDQRPKSAGVIKERFRQKQSEITLNDITTKASVFCDRGNAYASQNQFNRAITEYNEAIKIHPGFIRAYINRGSMYYNLRNYDLAIADYNMAIQIDSNTAKAYFNRGAAFYAKNMPVNALQDFETAFELDPNDKTAEKYIGIVKGELK